MVFGGTFGGGLCRGPLFMSGRGIVSRSPGQTPQGSPVRNILEEEVRSRSPLRGTTGIGEGVPNRSPSPVRGSESGQGSAPGFAPNESKKPFQLKRVESVEEKSSGQSSSRAGKRKWGMVKVGPNEAEGSNPTPAKRVRVGDVGPNQVGPSNPAPAGAPQNPYPFENLIPEGRRLENIFIEYPGILQDYLRGLEAFPYQRFRDEVARYFGPNSNPEVRCHYFSLEQIAIPGKSYPSGNVEFEQFLDSERNVVNHQFVSNSTFRQNFGELHFAVNSFLASSQTSLRLDLWETMDGLVFWSRENDAGDAYHLLMDEYITNKERVGMIESIIELRQRRDLYHYGMQATDEPESLAAQQIDALLQRANQTDPSITRREVIRGMQYWMVANPARSVSTTLGTPETEFQRLYDFIKPFITQHQDGADLVALIG